MAEERDMISIVEDMKSAMKGVSKSNMKDIELIGNSLSKFMSTVSDAIKRESEIIKKITKSEFNDADKSNLLKQLNDLIKGKSGVNKSKSITENSKNLETVLEKFTTELKKIDVTLEVNASKWIDGGKLNESVFRNVLDDMSISAEATRKITDAEENAIISQLREVNEEISRLRSEGRSDNHPRIESQTLYKKTLEEQLKSVLLKHRENAATEGLIKASEDYLAELKKQTDYLNLSVIDRLKKTYGFEGMRGWEIAVALFIGAVDQFVDAVRKYKEKTSTSYTQSTADISRLASIGITNLASGISPEKTAEAAAELTNFLGSSSRYSTELVTKSAQMSRFYGLSSDESATLLGNLKNATGGSEQLASDAIAYAGGLALANKVPVGKVLKEAAKNGGQLSTMSKSMVRSFIEASVIAGKMGISISDIAEKTKGLLDFEGTLEKQNTASIMLGKQINLIDVQRSRNARDMKGTLMGIKDIVDGIDLSQMTQIQLDSLQTALGGMTEEQIQKIKSVSKTELKNMSQADAKSLFAKNEGAEKIFSVTDGIYTEIKKLVTFLGKWVPLIAVAQVAGVGGGGGIGGLLSAGVGAIGLNAGGKFAGLGKVAGGLGGGMLAGSAIGAMGGASGGTSALYSAIGSGIGMAIGSFVPVIGTMVGGMVGGTLGGIAAAAFNDSSKESNTISNNAPAQNGEAVSSVQYGPQEVKQTISAELKPLVTELAAAIRNIPSSIDVSGDINIDGTKIGKWVDNYRVNVYNQQKGATNS